MLPRLSLPPTPLLMGLSYGEQSLCRVPPARGSSNALLLQFLYIWAKEPHLLPCGSISLTLSLWCQVCLRSSAVVNLHSASVLSSRYSWYQVSSLNFLKTIEKLGRVPHRPFPNLWQWLGWDRKCSATLNPNPPLLPNIFCLILIIAILTCN